MKTLAKAWIDGDKDTMQMLNANGITSFEDIEDRRKAIYDSLLLANDSQADINSLSNQFMLADKDTFTKGKDTFTKGILEPTQRIRKTQETKTIKTKGGWDLAKQVIDFHRQNKDIDKQIAATEARHALKQLQNNLDGSKARLDNYIMTFVPDSEKIKDFRS